MAAAPAPVGATAGPAPSTPGAGSTEISPACSCLACFLRVPAGHTICMRNVRDNRNINTQHERIMTFGVRGINLRVLREKEQRRGLTHRGVRTG